MRAGRDRELRTTPSNNSRAVPNPPPPPAAPSQNGRRLSARRSGRECIWPEPAHTEQSLARLARPTKGGAVRIRIALATAMAVIALPAIFFAFFSSTSAATTRVSRHEATSQHRTVKIDDTLMSYSQAQYAAKLVDYSNAVEL